MSIQVNSPDLKQFQQWGLGREGRPSAAASYQGGEAVGAD